MDSGDDHEVAAPMPEVHRQIETPEQAIAAIFAAASEDDALYCGLRQACQQIRGQKAKVCFLAEDLDDANYQKLILALCQENKVPVYPVTSRIDLGKHAGLFKALQDDACRVAKTSCAVITDVHRSNQALKFITENCETVKA